MDDRLCFEVSAEITDARCRVTHEPYEKCVLVVLGTPGRAATEGDVLQLWFRDPDTVVDLGKSLMTAGMRLTAQLRATLPDVEGSQESTVAGVSEEYPVPDVKPAAESLSDGVTDKE